MGDLHNRIAALSPQKIELLARRLAQRQQPAVPPSAAAEPQTVPPPAAVALWPGDDAETLLAHMAELPDEHVDALLRQMLGAPEAPAVPRPAAEELLENLDRYSDADVDSLIAELLAAQNDRNP